MTMIETPGLVIETPSVGATPGYSDTLITDLLSHIRLSGALFLRGRYSAPWALESPGNCDLIALLMPLAARLLAVHTIRQGGGTVGAVGMAVGGGSGGVVMLPRAERDCVGMFVADQPVQVG